MDGSGERVGEVRRRTAETDLEVDIRLDHSSSPDISTGLPFFDHMLTALTFHAGVDARIVAKGDLEVDAHHTIEDTGIALGQAIREALGERRGIRRFGSALVPLDEALCQVALDICGRPYLAFSGDWPPFPAGGLYPDLWPEFFRGLARGGGITLHVRLMSGANAHHAAEAAFKAAGLALADAVRKMGPDRIPSTKGMLE